MGLTYIIFPILFYRSLQRRKIISEYGTAANTDMISLHFHFARYLNRSLEHFRRLSRLIPNFTLVKIYEGKVRNQLIALVTPESSSDNEADRIFTQVGVRGRRPWSFSCVCCLGYSGEGKTLSLPFLFSYSNLYSCIVRFLNLQVRSK